MSELSGIGNPNYSKEEYDSFLGKVKNILVEGGLTCGEYDKTSDFMIFLENFIKKEIQERKVTDAIMGVVKKLSIIEINEISYPVVNVYKGHYLIGMHYFLKLTEPVSNREFISDGYIPVRQSQIIINS